MLTNPLSEAYNEYTIETGTELAYDAPKLNKWQYFWNNATKWFNNLHWGWKVGIGLFIIVALAIATIATGGATGSAAGFILAGATKGAIIGAATGGLVGAGSGLIKTAISDDWDNLSINLKHDVANGFLMGSISGAMAGGFGRANTLASWNPGNLGTSFKSMMYHYNKHVVKTGLNVGRLKVGIFGEGIVNYTKDAISILNKYWAQAIWKTYSRGNAQNGWLINVKFAGEGKGLYDALGRIIFYVYK